MPKFYCIHCGQHINASDEHAGSQASCPTCGGAIQVPVIAELEQIVAEVTETPGNPGPKPNRKNSFWASRSVKATTGAGVLCFLGVLIRPDTPLEHIGISDRGIAANLGESIGTLIGAGIISLVVALVISAILTAFKRRFEDSLSRGYSIGVLAVATILLAGNLFSRSKFQSYPGQQPPTQIERAHSTLSALEGDIKSMVKESVGPDGLPRKTNFRFDGKTAVVDDMDKMREIIHSFLNDMITLQNEYIQSLEGDGLNTLFEPDRVNRDTDFVESRAMLVRIKRTMSDAQTKASQLLADFPERINKYKFSSASDQGLLEGYQEGLRTSLPLYREGWDLEAEVVGHMEDLIDHLEVSRNYWKPDQKTFLFERDRDLIQFNTIMGKIQKCVARQAEIREESLKSATDKIGGLKERLER